MAITPQPTLHTERVTLAPLRHSHLGPFEALNQDPEVMAFMPEPLRPEISRGWFQRLQQHTVDRGFGVWALERTQSGEFLGILGLNQISFEAAFTPAVEILWRLARRHWGHGYATEAGREALRFAFEQLGLREVVSFTVPANRRSRAVMERLGLHHEPAFDFEHPRLDPGHPLRPHVFYRMRRP